MSAAAAVCAANAAEASTSPSSIALASTIYIKALAAAERNDTKALTAIWEQHGSRIFTEPLPEESGHILHYAAKKLRAKSVVWLLEQGADVNAIDREGEVRLYLVGCFLYFGRFCVSSGVVVPQPPPSPTTPPSVPPLLPHAHTHRLPSAGAPQSPTSLSAPKNSFSSLSTPVPTSIGKILMATPLSHTLLSAARWMPPVGPAFKRCCSWERTHG